MDQSLVDAQCKLMIATHGASNAAAARTVLRTLAWMRSNPRLALGLLKGEEGFEAEWSIRPKWKHKLVVMKDYEQAEREAQRLANELGRFVEIHHRAKPDKPLLAFTVHPDRGEDGARPGSASAPEPDPTPSGSGT